ncbi:MAG TPA: hypothetical protein VGJ08_01935 [Rhizomicrobium sp.]|jgi:uncharacterized membrane protein
MTLPAIIQQTANGSSLLYYALWGGVVLHIGGGTVGILSGSAAAVVMKGERLHRLFGTIFVVSMLTMAGAAIFVALVIPEKPNVLAGLFAFYLVASAWMTVKRREGTIGRLERGAALFACGATLTALMFGAQALSDPKSPLNASAPSPIVFFIFAFISALAAALDFRVIRQGGLTGAPRIARHAWRMCLGLFIATGSFFLGQQKIMPVWMRGSPVLLALGFAPLVLLAFWLIKIRFTNVFKKAVALA